MTETAHVTSQEKCVPLFRSLEGAFRHQSSMKLLSSEYMNPAVFHIHEELTKIAVIALIEVPHGAFHHLSIDIFIRPVHLAQQLFKLSSDMPRGLCIKSGILYPAGTCIGVSLKSLHTRERKEGYSDWRHLDDLPRGTISLDMRLPKDLFVGTLPKIELFGETLEGIGTLTDTRRLPETGHVHCVTGKPLNPNPFVLDLVVVETVVVKHFLYGRIL